MKLPLFFTTLSLLLLASTSALAQDPCAGKDNGDPCGGGRICTFGECVEQEEEEHSCLENGHGCVADEGGCAIAPGPGAPAGVFALALLAGAALARLRRR
jgi:MYXO-CTERM domain-containing protein